MSASAKRSWWGSLALTVLVLAAFAPILSNGFVNFDDPTYVTANPQVQRGLTWDGIKWAFETSTASNWHPLTWLSHMADCQVYGLRSWGHHLTSLLLHAGNTVLLFLLFKAMTRAPWRSWLLAALFGLHPLRVESVAWVAERKDVLSGLFFLLTLWAYWRYASSKRHLRRYYALALFLFTLGLLCKQMLVTLPFILLLLDVWPLRRLLPIGIASEVKSNPGEKLPETAPPNSLAMNRLILEKLPFFLLSAVFSSIVFLVQNRAGATRMVEHLPVLARLTNAVVAYALYLVKFFWPLDLAVFYPHPGYWPLGTVIGSALLLGGVTSLAWLTRQRRPQFLVGWLWYLGALVPVLGLVQVGRQSMADRYTYLPIIGLLLALIWTLASLLENRRARISAFAAAAVPLVVACAALTYRQAGFWKNSETLFRHAIDAVPDNYLAHGNMANVLQAQGRMDEALSEAEEAMRLNPNNVIERNNLGAVLLGLGRLDEAIGQFQESIRRWPAFAEAHSNLAFAYQRQGRLNDALVEFQSALKCAPRDFRLHVNLAGVLLKLGRPQEAIPCLEAAAKLEPGDATILKNLAGLLANAGRFEEAVPPFEAAAQIAADDPETEANLGICLGRLGRTEEAVSHLTRALRLRPDYPEAQQALQALRGAAKP